MFDKLFSALKMQPPPPMAERPLYFDPSLGLEFFNELNPLVAPNTFAFGDRNHALLLDGSNGLFVWVWKEDIKKSLSRSFCICASNVHGHKKKLMRCCFMSGDAWISSKIFVFAKKGKKGSGCRDFYKARFEIKHEKCKDKWVPVAVWRKDGPATPASPVLLPVALEAGDFNMALTPSVMQSAHESIFHVKEKVFGIALHSVLRSNSGVVIYGLKASMENKAGGFICAGITHKQSSSVAAVFAIPFQNRWRKANAVVTSNGTLGCCGSGLYKYEVCLFQKNFVRFSNE